MLPAKFSLLIFLILCHPASHTEVYKRYDERGTPVFSNTPSKDGKPVEILPPNIAKPTTPRPLRADPPPSKAPEYNTLVIQNPVNGGVIANGLVPFTVKVHLNPALKKDHTLTLLIDGKPYAQTTATQITVQRLTRGTHQLQTIITNNQGKALKQSSSHQIFVHQPGKQ